MTLAQARPTGHPRPAARSRRLLATLPAVPAALWARRPAGAGDRPVPTDRLGSGGSPLPHRSPRAVPPPLA